MSSNSIIPLIHFTNAELKSSDKLRVNLKTLLLPTSLKKSIQSNTNDDCIKSKRLKLIVHDEVITYEGNEEECPFLLGSFLKNGNNKQVSIFDTVYFVMKPECYIFNVETQISKTNMKNNTTYIEKLNSFMVAFGSSKTGKAMNSKLRNKMDSDSIEETVNLAIKDSLNLNVNENYKMANYEEEIAEIQLFSVLPSPNTNANTLEECYNLLEIFELHKEEFENLTNTKSIWFAETKPETVKEWIKNGTYPIYICHRLLTIGNSNIGHEKKMLKFKLLSLIFYLILMFRAKQNQLNSRSHLISSQVPDIVIKKLYDLYTIANGLTKKTKKSTYSVTMPQRLRHKLIAHILLLAWHIDNFCTELSILQKDLKISHVQLKNFYNCLGAQFTNKICEKTNSKKKIFEKMAEFKLPLH